MNAWTISYTEIGYHGARLPYSRFGSFATKADAQRWLNDNPQMLQREAKIVKTWARATGTWKRPAEPDADMGRMEHDDKGDN